MGIIRSTHHMEFPLKEGIRMRACQDLYARTRRILLIDDDHAVLDVTKRALESLGYEVTPAGSGTDALDLFRRAPCLYDLVITDMDMPRMRGDDLARQMQAVRSGMPVILYSGFADRLTPDEALKIGIREIMTKPARIMDMALTISRVLDSVQHRSGAHGEK